MVWIYKKIICRVVNIILVKLNGLNKKMDLSLLWKNNKESKCIDLLKHTSKEQVKLEIKVPSEKYKAKISSSMISSKSSIPFATSLARKYFKMTINSCLLKNGFERSQSSSSKDMTCYCVIRKSVV